MAVLSIAAMAFGQENYYLTLAAEDYYLNGGEPLGRWLGRGATALGLTDSVERESLRNLFQGDAPDGLKPLVQKQSSTTRARQPGWDLTFSAPKGVSLLWAIGDEAAKAEIQRAHFTATKAALSYLEEVASFSRRGHAGSELDRAGLVIATFEHGTSRAQDPQLHTHALIMNVGARPDGSFGTIRSRDLYQHKMAAGALYRTELAHQLSERLGLSFDRVKSWIELKGIQSTVLEAFSQRAAEINQALIEEGLRGPKAKEILALSTRQVKGHVSRQELFEHWRTLAQEHGFSPKEAQALIHGPVHRSEGRDERLLWKACVGAVKDSLERESAFTQNQLVRAVAERVQASGLPAAKVLRAVSTFLDQHPDIVRLGEKDGYGHYTNREMWRLEEALLSAAERSRDDRRHLLSADTIERIEKRYPTLRDEQRDALHAITMNPGSVQCLVGMAGTGKTFLLNAAREAWEQEGYRVIGGALAGKAARELEKGAAIQSFTLESLRRQIARPVEETLRHHAIQLARAALNKHTFRLPHLKLDPKTVLVIDEAGMVGTRMLEIVLQAAMRAGAKLVLVGDDRQLQPIEAGGPFHGLVSRLGAAKLTQIERQHEEWMRDAVRQFAEGDARGALTQYALAERLHVGRGRKETLAMLIERWAYHRGPLKDTLIIAGRDRDVWELNQRAQGRLKDRGAFTDRGFRLNGIGFHVGDRVLFTKNHKKLGVANGDLGTIEKIRSPLIPWKATLTIRLDREGKRGRPLRVTFSSQDYQHLELAYAVTAHKAQGLTVNRTFVLASGSMQDRELSYVQMSRAREDTRIFTTEADAGEDLVELAHTLSRSRTKLLAHDHHPEKSVSPRR